MPPDPQNSSDPHSDRIHKLIDRWFELVAELQARGVLKPKKLTPFERAKGGDGANLAAATDEYVTTDGDTAGWDHIPRLGSPRVCGVAKDAPAGKALQPGIGFSMQLTVCPLAASVCRCDRTYCPLKVAGDYSRVQWEWRHREGARAIRAKQSMN